MSVSLVELHILAGLAKNRTLLDIARDLQLGQPAVSKALRSAAARFGFQLVEHRGRRVCLTAGGLELARSAQLVVEQLQTVQQLAEDIRQGRRGRLSILATHTPGTYILPSVVANFLQCHPDVRIELELTSVNDDWTAGLDATYDLGVGPRPNHADNWQLEVLYEDHLRFVVSTESPLARKAAISWNDIADQPLIGPFSRRYWALILPDLEREGFRPGQQIGVHGLEGVKQLVEAGAGVGLLFEASLQREFREGRIVPLRIDSPALAETFYLIRRRGAPDNPVLNQFRTFLLEELHKPAMP